MGSCTSKQESRKGDINEIRVLPKSSFGEKREAQVSREIDHDIESSAVQGVRVKKLLLLGTGENGKITFLILPIKQIQANLASQHYGDK
jgi:hypothetical protein